MGQYVDYYCKNEFRELKKIINPILHKKFPWIAQSEYDDFYSIAANVVWECENNYQNEMGKSFDNFFIPCLHNKIKQRVTFMNRGKRMFKDNDGNFVHNVSFDTPIDEDAVSISDFLASDFNVEEEAEDENVDFGDEKVEKYLNGLSDKQRKIVEMKMNGYEAGEIKERLNLNETQYNANCKELVSFKNLAKLNDLKKVKYVKESEEEEKEMKVVTTQTMENCKTDKISIASIIKKIDKHVIRFDHPLQRDSDQWDSPMKGNMVSDVLQGNKFHPLIFAEQIINGIAIIWDLDGKQRCTNAYSFAKDGYKVSKNIRRWNIKYQTTKKDENGNDVLDEHGFPIAISAEFDIRGKRFSDLPEELQDKFLEYNFNYDQYLNCSEEDIGYHIERYNDGKPMTKPQKGITKLGTEFAEMVKGISAMPFFKNMGGYKNSEFKNGTIDRVVVESVMAINYLDDWKKDADYICKYLKDNACVADFDDFEDLIYRIEKVVTEDIEDMFDSKDSFLWFGLFSKFVKLGLEDIKFIEFLRDFSTEMREKEVNGTTFEKLCTDPKTGKTRSTKDKYIVVPKMELLEALMYEYFSIEKDDYMVESELDFIKKFVNSEITEEDIEYYKEDLEVLTLNVDNGSRLLDKENSPSLLAMIAYAYKTDTKLDEWFVEYFNLHNTYLENQKLNFLQMKKEYEEYLEQLEVA